MTEIPPLVVTVEGPPVPKGRPRFTRKGHAYTPRETRDYERTVGHVVGLAATRVGWAGVHAYETGRFRVRARIFKPTRRRMDADNVGKAVLDALNGVLWKDDSQVVFWPEHPEVDRERPRVELVIEVMS